MSERKVGIDVRLMLFGNILAPQVDDQAVHDLGQSLTQFVLFGPNTLFVRRAISMLDMQVVLCNSIEEWKAATELYQVTKLFTRDTKLLKRFRTTHRWVSWEETVSYLNYEW